MSLEYNTFHVLIYTRDGSQYNEIGQTIDTLLSTIQHYKDNYKIADIEIMRTEGKNQVVIPLIFYNPF